MPLLGLLNPVARAARALAGHYTVRANTVRATEPRKGLYIYTGLAMRAEVARSCNRARRQY